MNRSSRIIAMQPNVVSILVLAMSLPNAVQADPGTPKQQYSAILKEYNLASGGVRKAKTDLERKSVVERMATFPSKFVEIRSRTGRCNLCLEANVSSCSGRELRKIRGSDFEVVVAPESFAGFG